MKRIKLLGIATVLLLLSGGCGRTETAAQERNTDISQELTYTGSMDLVYAEKFAVDYYEDGYALITVNQDMQYLLVPEGMEAPKDLAEGIAVLQQPVDHIYLVASAVMDMFVSMDALDSVRFSGLQESGWYIEEAREAMEAGDILYAGKYSTPDYEQILAEGCGLAVENTMIYHTPEVKEQLENFGIPVLVDYSSYEAEPLGRTEWVKLYGLLIGKEEAAEEAFQSEMEAFQSIQESEEDIGDEKSVAFFYITANGEANVRKSSDYLAKMIGIAGGTYLFDDLGDKDDTASSTMSLQMEEFYAAAKDADYMIYNSTIEGELSSVEELLQKSPLLAKCKAVEEGNVYCTTENIYQSSMALGTILTDLHHIIAEDGGDLTYLYRLD